MGLATRLLAIERRFAWGFIGFVVGTSLGVAGLYFTLKEKEAQLSYELIGRSNVLDVHQPLADLSVFFKGEDIQKNNLNLQILRLRIWNEGDASVLQSMYDSNELWGLSIRPGRALEARLAGASSVYLRRAVGPRLINDSLVQLGKVILEPHQGFVIDLLVLHDRNTQPSIAIVGKVVGSDTPQIQTLLPQPRQVSIWRQIFAGSVWVHMFRAIFYFVLVTLSLAGMIGITVSLSERSTRRASERRAMQLRALIETKSAEEVLAKDVIVEIYAEGGLDALKRAKTAVEEGRSVPLHHGVVYSLAPGGEHRALAPPDELQLQYALLRGDPSQGGVSRLRLTFDPHSRLFDEHLVRKLKDRRLVDDVDGKEKVNPVVGKLLEDAIRRLQESV
jgi:hypothetical protein